MSSVGTMEISERHESTPELVDSNDETFFERNSTEDSPEKPMTQAELDREYLTDYYGGEQFDYNGYTGTIVQMLDSCPFAKFMLNKGPDAVIAWLDEYKMTVEAAQDEDSTDTSEENDKNENLLNDDATEDEQSAERTASEERAIEVDAVQTDEQPAQTSAAKPETQVVFQAEISTSETVKPEAAEAPGRESIVWFVEKEDEEESSRDTLEVRPKKKEIIESFAPAQESLPDAMSVSKPEDIERNMTAPDGDGAETAQAVEPKAAEVERSVELFTERIVENDNGRSAFDEPNDPLEIAIDAGNMAEPEQRVVDQKEAPSFNVDDETPIFANADLESVYAPERLETDTVVDTEPLVQATTPETVKDELFENYEGWRMLAKAKAPLGEVFTAISEQLDGTAEQGDEIASKKDQSDTVLDSVLIEAESYDSEPSEESYVEQALAQFDASEDTFDEVFEEEARPELHALFTAVRTVTVTIEKLYTATTKEECATYIEQLSAELSSILRALGYEHPELIVRDYLYSHSPESLKQLVSQLEQAARKAMYREMLQRKSQNATDRHTRLGKFVGFIMQAVSRRHPAFSTSIE